MLISSLSEMLLASELVLAVAESCTAGLVAAQCATLPGCSNWFWGGMVTYQTEAKVSVLGVSEQLIQLEGVVSEAVALAMAEGVLGMSPADVALAVTGYAGPDGGDVHAGVGTVCLAGLLRGGRCLTERKVFKGNRSAVRNHAATALIDLGVRLLL